MTSLVAGLDEILQHLEIVDYGFCLESQCYTLEDGESKQAVQQFREEMLQQLLYSRLHLRINPNRNHASDADAFSQLPDHRERAFVARLAKANQSRLAWDPGWQIVASEDSTPLLQKHGVTFRTSPNRVLTGDRSSTTDTFVSCRLHPEFFKLNHGYYTALGETAWSGNRLEAVCRFYWNVTASGAAQLLQHLTQQFNEIHVPFMCKCLSDPTQYGRSDALVLYIDERFLGQCLSAILQSYRDNAESLRSSTSLFAFQVAHGLGFAEQPSSSLSFGQYVSRRLARVLMSVISEPGRSIHRAELLDRLRRDGITASTPYLRNGDSNGSPVEVLTELRTLLRPVVQQHARLPASLTDSQLLAQRQFADPDRLRVRESSPASSYTGDPAERSPDRVFLEQAVGIGKELCRQAIWAGNRCTWLGYLPVHAQHQPRIQLAYGTLDANLYSGVTGVAIFLAELSQLTSDSRVQETALGALRQANALAQRLEPSPTIRGFYSGLGGLAYANGRIGKLIDSDEFLTASLVHIDTLVTSTAGHHLLDVLSGNAGMIKPLLCLRDWTGEAALGEVIRAWADEIVDKAVVDRLGVSWNEQANACQSSHNLTGFAHGCAGFSWAMATAHAEFGRPEYATARDAATVYEDHWYNDSAGNWPDFRLLEINEDDHSNLEIHAATTPGRFRTLLGWCHGAPGIGLGRLASGDAVGAGKALEATRSALRRLMAAPGLDFSLCHGAAGIAELPLLMAQHSGDSEIGRIAYRLGEYGIDCYGHRVLEWPNGVGEYNPSLMLGLSGIGYFYLRLYEPTGVPSILVPGLVDPLLLRGERS